MGDLDATADAAEVDAIDTPAEVEAAFRTQRRVALGYFALFAAITLGIPLATLTLEWWTGGRVVGGMSPSFVSAAIGLYVVFSLVVAAAAGLANSTEEQMLGHRSSAPVRVRDAIGEDNRAAPPTNPSGGSGPA